MTDGRTSEVSAALQAARDLVPGLAKRAIDGDRDAAPPVEDIAELRAAGLAGLMVPVELGGSGAGFADYTEVALTLAAGSPATALVFNMHASVTGAVALTSDEVALALGAPPSWPAARAEFLRSAAAGNFYAVAMSERAAGSRLSAMSSTYRADPDGGWIINADKAFCSGAGILDGYVLAAHAEGDPATVSQFVVPADTDGITVSRTWDPLGMRGTGSQDVAFDVRVGPEALLGGIEGLAPIIAAALPQWMVASYAAVYAGVAAAAVEAAAAYLTRRNLTALPSARARLGRADATAAAAAAVVRHTARLVDADPGDAETNRWVWRAKLVAGDAATSAAETCLQACGTGATRRGEPLERLVRDARCGPLQPPPSDVCADWLGAAALGLDPDDSVVPRW
jgi:alkylation response protein AidB-like acyl-CoA dehydrogenase